jgi:predicted transcriptional regulator
MTQGTSKKDAHRMIGEAIEALVDRKRFRIDVRPGIGAEFTIGANQGVILIALMLKRQREAHNLTLMEVARRLHSKSPNSYARYEQGKSTPTVEKLNQLMKAINPASEPILKTG